MFKVMELILGVTFLWWLGYIFIAGDPNERIERTCAPVEVVFGRFATSSAELAINEGDDVRGFFHKANYSCRYMVWNQFYGEEWRNSQHRQELKPAEVAEIDISGRQTMGIDGKPLPPLPGQERVKKPSVATPLDGVPPPEQRVPAVRDTKLVAPPAEVNANKTVQPLEKYKLPEKRPPDPAVPQIRQQEN